MSKMIKVTYEQMARILFENKEKTPSIVFYGSINEVTGCGEDIYKLSVLNFADSTMVYGNYYGGGSPFVYDITVDTDSNELTDALRQYFDYEGFGDSVYVETNFGSFEELPLTDGFSERPRIAIVVEDGFVQEVCATDPELIVEIIDKDNTDPDHQEEIGDKLAELSEQIENGIMHSVW